MQAGYPVEDMTDNELAKLHVRHMVGGRVTSGKSEILYRFEFPERPGALMQFLLGLGEKWNITMFHYRNHGAAWGRVLIGFEAPPQRAARTRALSRPHRLPLFRGDRQLRVPDVPALMPRLPLDIELDVTMRRQPNETTCGPTCLHAVYDYYEDRDSARAGHRRNADDRQRRHVCAVSRLPRAEARLYGDAVHVGPDGVRPELVRRRRAAAGRSADAPGAN